MRFGKQVQGETVRFCRIKRKGTHNCRVVWFDNNEEQLLPISAVTECSAVEAGYPTPSSTDSSLTETPLGDVEAPSRFPASLTGAELVQMMQAYQVTTKELASRLGISTERIREARSEGIDDPAATELWISTIQGEPVVA